MDSTEQRSGFRFPWTDRRAVGAEDVGAADEQQGDAPMATEAPPEGVAETSPESSLETPQTETPTAGMPDGGDPTPTAEPPRRPTRFLADLNRAMHVAAEGTRTSTLEQFRADGKTVVDEIHARSTDEVNGLRHAADDDMTGVREWSKAEIARIREETEHRIEDRRSLLDRELEGHTAVVEREVAIVGEQVATFEADMDRFFEQLLAEDDPSRFAALAASLPEPPIFRGLDEGERQAIIGRALAPAPEVEPEPVAEAGPVVEAAPEAAPEPVEPAAEAATTAAVAEESGTEPDPRLEIMGDLADAEAAALADVRDEHRDEGPLPDDAIAARLAGLGSAGARPAPEAYPGGSEGPPESSQVVVVGLTSVASIAAFKRQLGRLAGVRSVAVSSGPSGEFVFAITHDAGTPLGELVTTLAGFDPQVTRVADGLVEVTAHDPEA